MREGALALRKIFVVLTIMALGWQIGRWQEATRTHDVRRELISQMALNQAMMDECNRNLQNQFTPGYRTSLPLLGMEEGRPVLSGARGAVFRTQTSTNLACDGSAFLLVGSPEHPVLTRDGRFTLKEGRLVDFYEREPLGYVGRDGELTLMPTLESRQIAEIDSYGNVWAVPSRLDPPTGQHGLQKKHVFRLALAEVPRPEHLARFGVTGLVATERSGEARLGTVETLQTTILQPGSLELSNVDFYQQGMMLSALRERAGLLRGEPRQPAPPPMTSPPMMNPLMMNPPMMNRPSMGPGFAIPAGADPLMMVK